VDFGAVWIKPAAPTYVGKDPDHQRHQRNHDDHHFKSVIGVAQAVEISALAQAIVAGLEPAAFDVGKGIMCSHIGQSG
jgi:hypothetical protein